MTVGGGGFITSAKLSESLLTRGTLQRLPVFWDVLPCSLVDECQYFSRASNLCLQSINLRVHFYENFRILIHSLLSAFQKNRATSA